MRVINVTLCIIIMKSNFLRIFIFLGYHKISICMCSIKELLIGSINNSIWLNFHVILKSKSAMVRLINSIFFFFLLQNASTSSRLHHCLHVNTPFDMWDCFKLPPTKKHIQKKQIFEEEKEVELRTLKVAIFDFDTHRQLPEFV